MGAAALHENSPHDLDRTAGSGEVLTVAPDAVNMPTA